MVHNSVQEDEASEAAVPGCNQQGADIRWTDSVFLLENKRAKTVFLFLPEFIQLFNQNKNSRISDNISPELGLYLINVSSYIYLNNFVAGRIVLLRVFYYMVLFTFT